MTRLKLQRSIHGHPILLVCGFVLSIALAALGTTVWKEIVARDAASDQAKWELQNLAHSLAEHAMHTFKAADVAMTAMANLCKHDDPAASRLNAYLTAIVKELPQLREISILDAQGNWRYTSLDYLPNQNNAARSYFIRHRDSASESMEITGPITSNLTGRPTIVLSKRISDAQGHFAGIVLAAIDYSYFEYFYRSFGMGSYGGITLLTGDGAVLVRWPSGATRGDLSDMPLFRTHLLAAKAGFSKSPSPFDGIEKYYAYEESPEYQTVLIISRSADAVLSSWRSELKLDALVASLLMLPIIGMTVLLAGQFHYRNHLEKSLKDGKRHYRLLADNVADILFTTDLQGRFRYVSRSVGVLYGLPEETFIGRSCIELMHEDDRQNVLAATAGITRSSSARSVRFRTRGKSGEFIWLEAKFKMADDSAAGEREIVGVLRDVTQQKMLEDELSSANSRLRQLATTDGLTGLANRRCFDIFLREAYETHSVISMLLIDIDHFKGFNDTLGHQAGDACLRQIAALIGRMAAEANGFSARYGGEEFAVILPSASEGDAVKIAEGLCLAIRGLNISHPSAADQCVTISIGIACKTPAITDEIAMVRNADVALYEAKSRGRNRTVTSSSLYVNDDAVSLVPDGGIEAPARSKDGLVTGAASL